MVRRPTGRPSKGPRAVVLPRVLLSDDRALKALAAARGWYLSEAAANLINVGLRHADELPDDLPQRLPHVESTSLTARIPLDDDRAVRAVASERQRSISAVSGALLSLGLRYRNEIPGQIPAQYNIVERPLTKAS